MSTSVSMAVNETRLLELLRNSFSRGTTFIGELMQNARRAGATQINFQVDTNDAGTALCVSDDGRGIGNWSNLVSICESGWDDAVMTRDKPFGIGFLSALCAAQSLDVCSGGHRLIGDTDALLSRASLDLAAADHDTPGTSVGLSGIDVSADAVRQAVAYYAKGFDLPVSLDGAWLDRPHALDQMDGVSTASFGHARLALTGRKPSFYLQGLPVGVSVNLGTLPRAEAEAMRFAHVIHLDSMQFAARMPDRDVLIDPVEATARIAGVLHPMLLAHIQRLTATLDACALFQTVPFDRLHDLKASALINDVAALPASLVTPLRRVEHAILPANMRPDEDYFFGLRGFKDDRVETRTSLSATPLLVSKSGWQALLYSVDEHVPPVLTYLAHHVGLIVDTDRLDNGHWIFDLLTDANDLAVKCEAQGRTVETRLTSEYADFPVLLCESVRLTGRLGPITLTDWTVDEGGVRPMVPAEVIADAFQALLNFWDGDHEEFASADFSRCADELLAQVAALYHDDPTKLISSRLGVLGQTSTLRGRHFTLSFDEHGHARVSQAT